MTPEEKFSFDLEGYLVLKGVLTKTEIDELNILADSVWPGKYDESGLRRVNKISQWGMATQALIDHAGILAYLVELIGPKVRIDHDYSIFMRKGGRAGYLHGGPTPQIEIGDHWYRHHDGIIRNGLTVVSYLLTDARPEDGGFCCIPGSHKSNFVTSLPDVVRKYERIPHYVYQPPAKAGDVIIFTEALMHGTLPWAANHERRVLLYKYCPGHSAFSPQGYYDPADYPSATEQQLRLLSPPSILAGYDHQLRNGKNTIRPDVIADTESAKP